jgi:hypothetical protein
MDAPKREAYRELEDDMRKALKAHRGKRSVLSTMLNTLLLYPDHPYGIGTLYGTEFDPEVKRRVRFVIAEPRDTVRGTAVPGLCRVHAETRCHKFRIACDPNENRHA